LPTVATYEPPAGEPAPQNFTAADLEAVLVLGHRVVKIAVRVGKGMGVTRKMLTMAFKDRPNMYLNLDEPDAACDLDYVPHTARAASIDVAASLSSGFGGIHSTIVLERAR